jgi:hypothetical protein
LAGTPDFVSVDQLLQDDIVKVYSSLKTTAPIGVAVAGDDLNATVYIHQLGTKDGSVYVTVTSGSSEESARTEAAYSAENQSAAVLPEDVTIQNNNSDFPDVVSLSNRTAGEILRIYSGFTSSIPLGKPYHSGTTAVIVMSHTDRAGTPVQPTFTVQKPNEMESVRKAVSFDAETFSAAPSASQITVVNNYNASDTVTVTGFHPATTVTVYASARGNGGASAARGCGRRGTQRPNYA